MPVTDPIKSTFATVKFAPASLKDHQAATVSSVVVVPSP